MAEEDSYNQEQILKAVNNWMDNYIDTIFQYSQENLSEPHLKQFKSGKVMVVTTTDTGMLMGSGNVNHKFLDKTITYSAPYSSDLEYGSTTAIIDEDQIYKWVKRKLLNNKYTNKEEWKIRRVAKNIVKSLKERGISADSFIRPAIQKANKKFGV